VGLPSEFSCPDSNPVGGYGMRPERYGLTGRGVHRMCVCDVRLVKMAVIRPPSVSPVPPPEQNNTVVEKESIGAGETKSKPPLREYTL